MLATGTDRALARQRKGVGDQRRHHPVNRFWKVIVVATVPATGGLRPRVEVRFGRALWFEPDVSYVDATSRIEAAVKGL